MKLHTQYVRKVQAGNRFRSHHISFRNLYSAACGATLGTCSVQLSVFRAFAAAYPDASSVDGSVREIREAIWSHKPDKSTQTLPNHRRCGSSQAELTSLSQRRRQGSLADDRLDPYPRLSNCAGSISLPYTDSLVWSRVLQPCVRSHSAVSKLILRLEQMICSACRSSTSRPRCSS